MKFIPTPLSGSYLIQLEPYSDERGWFARTYSSQEFATAGHKVEWLQQNHSFTAAKGTIRGMHFQFPPHTEIKLVRCIAGSVYDVIVDLRSGSATFLQTFGALLSAENKAMMYVPEGFAHGFQAMDDNTELVYNHSQEYHPSSEGGLRFDDPELAINWPLPVINVSGRDQSHPYIDKLFQGINISSL